MNVSKLVQLIHRSEHLADIEAGVLFFQYTGVVEQRTKVSPRDVLHREVDVRGVLECVE